MKKDVFKNCDFETLIEVHNPFAIKSTDGNIKFFANYAEVYLFVLNILHLQFPKGYVDLILLVNILTNLPVGPCEEMFRQMRSIWGNNPERMISYDWDSCCTKDNRAVADIMRCLHVMSETAFDPISFDKACDLFSIKLAREGQLKAEF